MQLIFILLGLIFIIFSIRFTWWWMPFYNGFLVFMFHHIRPVSEHKEDEDSSFSITPEIFEKQVKYLISKKYNFIGLEDLSSNNIKKPVMLTFDDGYVDNYKFVFPILKKYNIKAVIFLIAGKIGIDPELMTWEQVFEMQKSGLVSFGSHGLTHANIRRMEEQSAIKELRESKHILETKLGHNISAFCYPFGAGGKDDRIRKLVFDAGYLFDFSTRRGLNPWPLKNGRTIYRAFPRGGETKLDFVLQTHLGRSKL